MFFRIVMFVRYTGLKAIGGLNLFREWGALALVANVLSTCRNSGALLNVNNKKNWRMRFRFPLLVVRVWCRFWSSAFGLAHPACRWFRLTLFLFRAWCWFLVLCVCPWFWSCAVVSFNFSCVRRLVLVDPGQNLENLRCKLFVFK